MRWLALVAVAGCGRFGFTSEPPADSAMKPAVTIDSAAAVAIDASAPIDAPFACPSSYTLVGGTSLYRVGAASSWPNAEGACEADGAGMHLATIAEFTEQQKIESFLSGKMAWIGVSDRKTDNNFLAVTGGGETYLPWANNFPNVVGPGCVLLDPVARKYQDADCAQSLGYVCECDGVVADPNSY